MKGRIIRALACLLVLAAVPCALLAFAFGLPAQYGATFLGELPHKAELLAAAPGRRVVVVGGSAVAFGLRSDLLEGALPGYTAVNFGLYAGLGSTAMLELAEGELRPGDIVVFSPEQSGQTLSMYFGGEAMWQAADGCPALLGRLGREKWGALAGSFPAFAAGKARDCRDGNAPAGEGVYARSSFNARGDIDYAGRERNVMTGGMDPNMPIAFDPALPAPEFLDYVRDYAARCREKGVAFYYRFCPMNAAALGAGELDRAEGYAALLSGALGCPVLGTAEEAVLEKEWFYDTNFHLNSAGAVVNTARLAAALKEALGLEGGEDIELPPMPGAAQAETFAGDDTDGDCFRYEDAGEGLRIVGLTAAGAARERLTVPAACGGRAVVSLAPAAFAGNTAVREVVLQANLRGLEDGSFAGCTALERIVLRNLSPSSCPVGAGLLEGTAAAVIVPEECLSAYRTNYFWAPYAGRIRGEAMDLPGAAKDPAPTPTPVPTPAPVAGPSIRYEGNGGVLRLGGGTAMEEAVGSAHLRPNTLQGTRYFVREGWALVGWNTAPDGSGTAVGLGSRVDWEKGLTLYAQWLEESPSEDFAWEDRAGEAWITDYRGPGGRCVIPAGLGGVPVRGIRAGAFREAELELLALPEGLRTVEAGAFTGCAVGELYLCDGLTGLSGAGFDRCDGPERIHINASTDPVYSTAYYAAFADKYDRLLTLAGEKKLVLFSGSSTRYGYRSAALEAAYPAYRVVNMGVYAYTNALPQLELIRAALAAGDVLLHAPEFDPLADQFCVKNTLDPSFWPMMEANYDMAAGLDLREYTGVLDSLGEYLSYRVPMEKRTYNDSPNGYDDDGNRYPIDTYNAYGDFVLPRPNAETDGPLVPPRADYRPEPFTDAVLEGMNREYRRFLADGVEVYFTYTPRNIASLTEGSTPAARAALDGLLRERLCVPVISRMEESLYPGRYFYLIDSHLSDEGAALYTARVIEDLRPWLEGRKNSA